MATLGDMIDRIADELARDDLNAQITRAIQTAIDHYAGEPWFFNETKEVTITMTSSVEFYDLPLDFEHVDTYQVNLFGNHMMMDEHHFDTLQRWQTSKVFGWPTCYAVYGGQLLIYPIPNTSIDTILSYTATVPTLSSTVSTNAFMTYGEELVRARAKADVQVNVLRDEGATAEYLTVMQSGMPYYSFRERSAYQGLRARTTRRMSTARLRPIAF